MRKMFLLVAAGFAVCFIWLGYQRWEYWRSPQYKLDKLVASGQINFLWFSKQILPAIRNEDKIRATSPMSPVYRHIGLYAYRTESLQKFQQLPEGVYEKLEGLEQLRFMENGMTIHAVTVEKPTISMSGIDTPEDAELATTLIAKHGDPFNQ